jgi:hypothetical protein
MLLSDCFPRSFEKANLFNYNFNKIGESFFERALDKKHQNQNIQILFLTFSV